MTRMLFAVLVAATAFMMLPDAAFAQSGGRAYERYEYRRMTVRRETWHRRSAPTHNWCGSAYQCYRGPGRGGADAYFRIGVEFALGFQAPPGYVVYRPPPRPRRERQIIGYGCYSGEEPVHEDPEDPESRIVGCMPGR